MTNEFSDHICQVTTSLIKNEQVSENDIYLAFDLILKSISPLQIASFLSVLAAKGENSTYVCAARKAILGNMVPVTLNNQDQKHAVDIVGTGGDGLHTLNISTAASLLVASCHVPIAKHGNRAVSSKAGAFDVLNAMGYLAPKPDEITTSLLKDKFLFLFAPYFHPGLKNVTPIRQEIKIPTIFNVLGPLCNPARVPFMVIGAVGLARQRMMAEAIKDDVSCAVVIGNDDCGADEILSYGRNSGFMVKQGKISSFSFTAEDAGFRSDKNIDALKGDDADYNASKIRSLFAGEENSGCFYASVVMTASCALYIAGKVASLREGSFMAANALANKKPLHLLSSITDRG